MTDEKLKEETPKDEFRAFMKQLGAEVNKALNMGQNRKVGFSLLIFDGEGKKYDIVSAMTNVETDLVEKVLGYYLASIKVHREAEHPIIEPSIKLVKG